MLNELCNLQEEDRLGFVVSEETKSLWNIQLNMLQKLLDVCQKYNLRIYASGGTMLGAVRHKGYIPWDDDIDMDMLREDYDKLVQIAPYEFGAPYFFQCAYTEDGYYRGHAQLRFDNTAQILSNEIYRKFNQGIFIDIFVVDGVPEDINVKHKIFKKSQQILSFLWLRKYKYNQCLNPLLYIKSYLRLGIHSMYSDLKLYSMFEDLFRKHTCQDCKEVGLLAFMPWDENTYYKSEWYGNVTYMPFEKIHIPVSIYYHEMLTKQYGKDYMTPIQCLTMHGTTIVDTEHSYKIILNQMREPILKRIMGKIVKKITGYDRDIKR